MQAPRKEDTSDRWSFYIDESKDWRWRRTSINGMAVAVSAQSFKVRAECEADARHKGWKG
jgi:hypothetical protein